MEINSVKLNISGRRVNARDLTPEAHFRDENSRADDHNEEKIELGLGLSTNGRFGVDPSTNNLKRSYSVSNLASDGATAASGGGNDASGAARGDYAPPERAASLPLEMEELFRRRRRLAVEAESGVEARKKRAEKMKGARRRRGIYLNGGSRLHGNENGGANVQFLGNGGGGVVNGPMMMLQPMVRSQRDSTGFPVPHSPVMMMGPNQNTMMRTSASRQALKEEVVEGSVADNIRAEKQKLLRKALLEMPHVSTGPDHSRVEGILYRYRRADELKIVCVCHGLFLSPAEFVRHGGGGDVAQPLKHIVVNPFPIFQV